MAILTLKMSIIDEAQDLSTTIKGQKNIFREHLMSVINTLVEKDEISTLNSLRLINVHFMMACVNEPNSNWLVGRVAQWYWY